MTMELDLGSIRARKARLSAHLGHHGHRFFAAVGLIFGAAGTALWVQVGFGRLVYAWGAIALGLVMVAFWQERDLRKMPPVFKAEKLDDILEPALLASFKKGMPITPRTAWAAANHNWEGRFLVNHMLLDINLVGQALPSDGPQMEEVWKASIKLMEANLSPELDSGVLAAALLTVFPASKEAITKHGLKESDIQKTLSWQQRLGHYLNQPHPYFGGIGRDWAAGFTPTLDKFSRNISQAVERGEGHFHTLAHGESLDPVAHNLSQGTGGVALVGEPGTGRSSMAYALAERLLRGQDPGLLYYQVVSLNASMILSSAGDKLERVMLTIFGEAIHAGNIILFLDDAKLFFGKGAGAFDMSQILLPVLQNRQLKLICAFTPQDFQRLKADNSTLASLLTVVTVPEPKPDVTLKILEDTALSLEVRDGLLISLQAINEAYRLSGQYDDSLAYPGKAISLLEQATAYAVDKVLTAESVQQAIEKTRGVKVSKAKAAEADVLLHLEDHIHRRMVNQERAVKVVASALRRGRAGVSNPDKPLGSFLFLGPTGVGKTELARSLAATYFGDESRMIRLDMSEYQRPDDVARLLDPGTDKAGSLIQAVRQQPFSVVLLDEVEKGHPNVLNLLLQMLDEGRLSDDSGKAASFKNAIIITTSNAGSAEITKKISNGETLEKMEKPLIEELIQSGQFKPELINRFDDVVLFKPLNETELAQVASRMLEQVNQTLKDKNITVKLTNAALSAVVKAGYDPSYGARPMRRAIQKMVEDPVAKKVLAGEAQPGSIITLDEKDLSSS